MLVKEQQSHHYGWFWMGLCLWMAFGGVAAAILLIHDQRQALASAVDIRFVFAVLHVVLGSIGAVAWVALRRGVGASWNWIRGSAWGLLLSMIAAVLIAQVHSIKLLGRSGIGVSHLIQYVVLDVLDELALIVLLVFAVLITTRKENRDIFLGERKARPLPDKNVWP